MSPPSISRALSVALTSCLLLGSQTWALIPGECCAQQSGSSCARSAVQTIEQGDGHSCCSPQRDTQCCCGLSDRGSQADGNCQCQPKEQRHAPKDGESVPRVDVQQASLSGPLKPSTLQTPASRPENVGGIHLNYGSSARVLFCIWRT